MIEFFLNNFLCFLALQDIKNGFFGIFFFFAVVFVIIDEVSPLEFHILESVRMSKGGGPFGDLSLHLSPQLFLK